MINLKKLFWIKQRPITIGIQINKDLPPCVEFYIPWWGWPFEIVYRIINFVFLYDYNKRKDILFAVRSKGCFCDDGGYRKILKNGKTEYPIEDRYNKDNLSIFLNKIEENDICKRQR